MYCSLNVWRRGFQALFNIFIKGPRPFFLLCVLFMLALCPHSPKRMAMIIRALTIIITMIMALCMTSLVATTVLSPFSIFTH